MLIAGLAVFFLVHGRWHAPDVSQKEQTAEQLEIPAEPSPPPEHEAVAEEAVEEPVHDPVETPLEPIETAMPEPMTDSTPEYTETARDPVAEAKEAIMNGRFGQMPIEELIGHSIRTRDPSRRDMRLALLVRKDESLPAIKWELLESRDNDYLYELLMLIQGQLRWSEFTPEVLILLNDDSLSERVRGSAATVLALFQKRETLPAIRNLVVYGEDNQARQIAANALGLLGNAQDVSLIEPMLLDESPYVRATGAMVLGYLGKDSGLDEALRLSTHEKFDIRMDAAGALSLIGTREALERLQEMTENDLSSTVRKESNDLLARAELEKLHKYAAIDKLKQLLTTETSSAPRWAFVYLAEYFGNESKEFLRQLAETPGPMQYPATVALLQVQSGTVMIPYRGN